MKEIQPYKECPRFDWCSSNKCPLDPDLDKRVVLPDDPKCTAFKSIRMKIAANYPVLLPRQGLTKYEWKAKKTWATMDPAKKEKIKAAGLEKLKSIKKGVSDAS